MDHDIVYTDVEPLYPHPLDARLYGANEPVDDLVESVRQYGVRVPLLVTPEGMVISGVRRLKAARQVGLSLVPVYYTALTDPIEIELAVIDCNRQREKTKEQRAREFIELERIEKVLADRRMKSGKSVDGTAGGRGNSKATFELQAVPLPTVKSAAGGSQPQTRGDIKNPELNLTQGLGRIPQARAAAAKRVDWSATTAVAAKKVVQHADETGDRSVIKVMEDKSVRAAMEAIKRKNEAKKPPIAVPPLRAQSLAVWEFAGPVAGMGLDSDPSRLSGDLIRNLYWFFTRMDDQVIALNDPAGVALDAARCFAAQPDGWETTCRSFAPGPRHPEVAAFDSRQKAPLPPEAAGAGLIFLDADAWVPKGGGMGESPLASYHQRLLAFLAAAVKAVRPGGHVVLLVRATLQTDRRVDQAAHLVTAFTGAPLRHHLIVQPEVGGHDQAAARQQRRILDTYLDLLVFERPRSAELNTAGHRGSAGLRPAPKGRK